MLYTVITDVSNIHIVTHKTRNRDGGQYGQQAKSRSLIKDWSNPADGGKTVENRYISRGVNIVAITEAN